MDSTNTNMSPVNPSPETSVKKETPDEFLKKVEQSFADRQKISQGVVTLQKINFANKLEVSKAIEKKLPPMHILLSKLPEDIKNTDNFLKAGDSIVDTNKKVIEKNIVSIKSTGAKKVKVSLTKEEVEKLKLTYPGLKNIPHGDFDKHVFGTDNSAERSTAAYRQYPMLTECASKNPNACISILDAISNDSANPVTPPDNIPPESTNANEELAATKEDIYKEVTNLLAELSPPEYAPVLEIKKRATETDVQDSVNAFQFNGGPADQPAFYDFYSLQIAFEHVWQEVFDQSINDLVHRAYNEIVNNQIELPSNTFTSTRVFMAELNSYLPVFAIVKNDPPLSVLKVFTITQEEWWQLSVDQRQELENLADKLNPLAITLKDWWQLSADQKTELQNLQPGVNPLTNNSANIQAGNNIIQYAREKIKTISNQLLNQKIDYNSLSDIIDQLDKRLKEKYAFTIFAANEKERSVNFGIVLNYRQKWTPLAYQAGELIKTIPLAPKEVRKYSKKITTKQSKSEKDSSSTSSKSTFETSDSTRSEAEIVDKAFKKMNANVSAKAGYGSQLSPWSFSVEASYAKESSSDSSQTKKDLREAVVKSAQELKNDRSVEINTSDSTDFEADESGEISNPNDEIAVTYLFYELQRRYKINEFLNRITPVVMVAQEVPSPDEIDEDWLICYQWILSKVILDQSFQPALYYLVSKVVGDEYALEEQRKNLEQQREMVNELQEEFIAIKEQYNLNYQKMEDAVNRKITAVEEEHYLHFKRHLDIDINRSADFLDVAKAREESYKEEYERTVKDEREMRARLEREVTALQATTDNYTKTLSEHLNRKTEIKKLQVHVKENIIYYMQAIWTFEPQDQRYLRLFQTKVPVLDGNRTYNLLDDTGAPTYPNWDVLTDTFQVSCELNTPITYKTLVEVADVDHLLGFKGNYMIFPLLESNILTDYMMIPYINKYSGIADPDPAGNWSLDDFSKYICCLKTKLENNEITQQQFDNYKPALADLYKELITDPLRENEEIVIPTKSLFIEALPGVHPILEDFKLMHRAVDVKKVQAEVRYAEMENLRSAARLVTDQLEDPSIEKKIVIEGGDKGIVINPAGE